MSNALNTTLAQTYPQLMNQAIACDYSNADLLLLKKAFEFSHIYSDGIYRAQKVPLINHVTRTASILIIEKCSVNTLIVGILHAAFVLHKFNNSQRSTNITQRKREIQDLFGLSILISLLNYSKLEWYSAANLNNHIEKYTNYDSEYIRLIQVQLANELEDHLDKAMYYTPQNRIQQRNEIYFSQCITLAKLLKFDFVAQELSLIENLEVSHELKSILAMNNSQGFELPLQRKWQKSIFEKLKNKACALIKKSLERTNKYKQTSTEFGAIKEPLKVTILNSLVNNFPRRIIPRRFYHNDYKLVSHPLFLEKKLISNSDIHLEAEWRYALASKDDINAISLHPESLSEQVYENRVNKGDICYVLKVNDEIVSFNWISFDQCAIFRGFGEEVTFFDLNKDQCFTYDFYTYKKHRKCGYGHHLKHYLLCDLFDQGLDTIFSCVHQDNVASLIIHAKENYTIYGRIYNYKLLDWSFSFFNSPSEKNNLLHRFNEFSLHV